MTANSRKKQRTADLLGNSRGVKPAAEAQAVDALILACKELLADLQAVHRGWTPKELIALRALNGTLEALLSAGVTQ